MKTFFCSISRKVSFRLSSCLFLIPFFIYSNTLYAQTIGAGQNLYISMGDLGSAAKTFMSNNNVGNVITFNISGDNYSALNTVKITADIKNKFPGASDSGIGVLDWEGKAFEALRKGPSDPEFKNNLQSFLSILQFAKSIRPNVKWGFYGIPFTTYYNRNTSWKQSGNNIEQLLQQCDAFFPSLYVSYKDGSVGKDDNEAYAKDNVLQALTLASNVNKPVLPFVWHRYHVSNKTIGLQLIPIDEFKRYINSILSVSYNGKKVAGVVWWGSDTYYYNIKSQALVNEMSGSNQTNFTTYRDNLVINYGQEILKTIKSNN